MRRLVSLPVVLCLAAALAGPASAATPIRQSGDVGAYAIEDTAGQPGARCTYDSGAGSHYLASVRAKVIAMWGTSDDLQQVGYRLLLQQKKPSGWKTVAVGPLKTALAEEKVGNGVAASTVVRDPDIHPNGAKYRAVLRLLWFSNDDGSVEGRVFVRIDHHRRTFNDSVRPACKGQVSTGIGGAARAT